MDELSDDPFISTSGDNQSSEDELPLITPADDQPTMEDDIAMASGDDMLIDDDMEDDDNGKVLEAAASDNLMATPDYRQ